MTCARRIATVCIVLAIMGLALTAFAGEGIPHALGLRMSRPSPKTASMDGLAAADALGAEPVKLAKGSGPFSLASSMPTPMDQGPIGSCGSCATGYAWKSHMEAMGHGWSPSDAAHTFSPNYLYNQINGGGDNGSYFDDNFSVLCMRGISTLADQPYSTDFATWPTQNQCAGAHPWRNAYVKKAYIGTAMSAVTPKELAKIKSLIKKGIPVLIGIWVDSAFDDLVCGTTNYVWYPSETGYRGGHAVCIMGYDDTISDGNGHVGAFEIQNSWGTGWCNGGRAYIAYDAFYYSSYVDAYVYYGAMRKAYTPTMKAEATISHPKRGDVFVQIGAGKPGKPKWSEWFYYPLVMNDPGGIWDETHANIAASMDVTGGGKCWPPSGKNVWCMMVWDSWEDGVSGTVTQFRVQGPTGWVSATTPVVMNDSGPTYIYLGGAGSAPAKGAFETCCDELAE